MLVSTCSQSVLSGVIAAMVISVVLICGRGPAIGAQVARGVAVGGLAAWEVRDADVGLNDQSHLRAKVPQTRRLDQISPPTLQSKWLDRIVLVPEHKLLFCFLDKVGSKQFTTLFRNLRFPDTYMKPEYRMVWHVNQALLLNYSHHDVERLLADPSWHKAVFYREPLERFLSAFRSKCEKHDRDGPHHCMEQFGKFPIGFNEAAASVAGWSQKFRMNRHFELQSRFCGGLGTSLQFYDTVELLERDTSRQKVIQLLRKVGVDAQRIPEFDDLYPPRGNDAAFVAKNTHNTGSAQQFFDYYGNVPIKDVQKMLQFYREDYQLFNITIPSFWHV